MATGIRDLIILKRMPLPSWKQLFAYGEKLAKSRRIMRGHILEVIRAVRREE